MTINEYAKSIKFPEMKLLGVTKNFKFYIRKNIPDMDLGIPPVIRENINKNTFEVLDANEALSAMAMFNRGD